MSKNENEVFGSVERWMTEQSRILDIVETAWGDKRRIRDAMPLPADAAAINEIVTLFNIKDRIAENVVKGCILKGHSVLVYDAEKQSVGIPAALRNILDAVWELPSDKLTIFMP